PGQDLGETANLPRGGTLSRSAQRRQRRRRRNGSRAGNQPPRELEAERGARPAFEAEERQAARLTIEKEPAIAVHAGKVSLQRRHREASLRKPAMEIAALGRTDEDRRPFPLPAHGYRAAAGVATGHDVQ